jgi:hypothetical protein
MTEVPCEVCREHDERVPAPMAFCVECEDEPDAPPQSVHCCNWREGQAAVAAALMRSHLAPAAVYRRVLPEGAEGVSSP